MVVSGQLRALPRAMNNKSRIILNLTPKVELVCERKQDSLSLHPLPRAKMEDISLDESVLNRRAGRGWHRLSWTMLTEPPCVRHASFPFISVQLFLQTAEVLCLDLVYRFAIGFSYPLSSSRVTGKAAGLPHSGAVILRKGKGTPP